MEVFILIGNIGSGKTTWINKNYPNEFIISRDNLRKEFAKGINKEYLFDPLIEQNIKNIAKEKLIISLKLHFPKIIIDETNTTIYRRSKIIKLAKKYNYKLIAVIMPKYNLDFSVNRRLSNNHGNVSKTTWENVYEEININYEDPSFDEGFDEIIHVNQAGLLANMMYHKIKYEK